MMRWYLLIGAVIVSAGVLGIGHRVTAQTKPAPVEFAVEGVAQPLTPLTVRLTLANPVSGAATLIVADPVGHQIASVDDTATMESALHHRPAWRAWSTFCQSDAE